MSNQDFEAMALAATDPDLLRLINDGGTLSMQELPRVMTADRLLEFRRLTDALRNAYEAGAKDEREYIESWICRNHFHEDDLLAMIRARGEK